jgi:hypothetical protein
MSAFRFILIVIAHLCFCGGFERLDPGRPNPKVLLLE